MVFNDKAGSKLLVALSAAGALLAFWAVRPVNASDAASGVLPADPLPVTIASMPGGEHRLLLSQSGSATTPASPAGEVGVDPSLEAALVLVPPPAWAGLLVLAAMAVGRTRQRRRYRRRR